MVKHLQVQPLFRSTVLAICDVRCRAQKLGGGGEK